MVTLRGFPEHYAQALAQHAAYVETERKARIRSFWIAFGLVWLIILGGIALMTLTVLLLSLAGAYALIVLIPAYLLGVVVLVLSIRRITKSFSKTGAPLIELPSEKYITEASWLLNTLRSDLRLKALPTTTLDLRPRYDLLESWGSAGKGVQTSFSFEFILADRTKARLTLDQRFKRKIKTRFKRRRGTIYIAKDVVFESIRVSFRPPAGQSFDPAWQQLIAAHPPRIVGMPLTGGGVRANQAMFVFSGQKYRQTNRFAGYDVYGPKTPISTVLMALLGSYKSLVTAKRRAAMTAHR